MTVTCYPSPGKAKAMKICAHFAKGCRGRLAPIEQKHLNDGPAFFYGWTEHTVPLIERCKAESRDWYYADNAYYFGRGRYFRVTRNALMHDGAGLATAERWQSFAIDIKPWRKTGRHIVIATQSEAYYSMRLKISREEWTRQVIAELARHTDRPVTVCHKPDAKTSNNAPAALSFEAALAGAWACVIHSSSTGVKALIEGVPVISLGQSMCATMGRERLADIEAPYLPDDRFRWLCVLAANQWTYDELDDGAAWRYLQAHRISA